MSVSPQQLAAKSEYSNKELVRYTKFVDSIEDSTFFKDASIDDVLDAAAKNGYYAVVVNFSRWMGPVHFDRNAVDIVDLRARGFEVRRFINDPRQGLWHWWNNTEAAILIEWGPDKETRRNAGFLNFMMSRTCVKSQYYLLV